MSAPRKLVSIPATVSVPLSSTQKKPTESLHGEILVQGGSFLMGSASGESDEKPVHQVSVSSFWMVTMEVNQKDHTALMGANPSKLKGDNLPVSVVSWHEAIAFANKLSIQDKLHPVYTIDGTSVKCDWSASGWRLPTEAEWEFAARGGIKSKSFLYAGSNDVDSVAWHGVNSRDPITKWQSNIQQIGSKAPNELELYDLSGNVWEWCWDWHGTYGSKAEVNPTGPLSGKVRVPRGGAVDGGTFHARSTYRGSYVYDSTWKHAGFRLVRKP